LSNRTVTIELLPRLEGRLLSSLSEQSEKFSKSSDWLEKSHFCFNHV